MNQKRDLNRISMMLVVFNIVMGLTTVIVSVVMEGAGLTMEHMGRDGSLFYEFGPVSGYLAGLLAGILVIVIFSKKVLFLHSVDVQNKHMGILDFFTAVMILFGFQMFYSIFSTTVEQILNQCGLSLQSEIDAATGMGMNVSMVLYTVIAGPVAEELVFRGVLLRSFEKYGKVFAIVCSAFLFGAYHGNFLQGMFAFTTGVLFAYIAEEYSIRWSIALHLLNNFTTIALGYAQKLVGEGKLDGAANLLFLVCMIGTVLWLVKNRKAVKQYISGNPMVPGTLWIAATRPAFLVFIGYEVLLACAGVRRI